LHRASTGDNLSTVVRAQTLAALEGLDPDRKRILLMFLYESGLIDKDKPVVSLSISNLGEANLRGANLRGAILSYADLSGANMGDGVYLMQADLSGAQLNGTDLSNARLNGAKGVTEEQLKQAKTLEGATMP
jgi:uncharacterized protein YjbI with pentapeptide repeats